MLVSGTLFGFLVLFIFITIKILFVQLESTNLLISLMTLIYASILGFFVFGSAAVGQMVKTEVRKSRLSIKPVGDLHIKLSLKFPGQENRIISSQNL